MPSDPQVVLITGAAGQLGRALAARFAPQGNALVLLDREGAALQGLVQQHPEAVALATDLQDARMVTATVAQALQRFGRIDVAVHLAGGFTMGEAVHETSAASLQSMLDLNVYTMLHSAAAVVPAMRARKSGVIVNVGAASAVRGLAHMGAYIASKSALMRLTESMSAELRDEGIRVNAVLPSILDTPANRQDMPGADHSRWVALDALAAVIAFLASDDARAIHGACVPVTGRV